MKVEVNQVSKVYQRKPALDQLTFTLDEPKIYGLLGRNGAGKTTIMQLLNGLMKPSSGEIKINGENPPVKKKVFRRRVKTVIQNLITLASKMVRHARKHYLKFGNNSPWFLTFKRVYTAFLC